MLRARIRIPKPESCQQLSAPVAAQGWGMGSCVLGAPHPWAPTPAQVVNLLDRLFTLFDQHAGKHEVYCFDVIGDAWLGCSGLMRQPHIEQVRDRGGGGGGRRRLSAAHQRLQTKGADVGVTLVWRKGQGLKLK